jgi:hypothetical protein
MKAKGAFLALLVIITASSFSVDSADACWRLRCRRCSNNPCCPAAVLLSWNFEIGKTFYVEMTTTTEQSMKVMGRDVTQNQSQTFYSSFTPKDKDKENNWIVVEKIEGVKMDIEITGQKIRYDSTMDKAGQGNPLDEFFKALVGAEFELTISPQMKIIKIEGRDKLINKMITASPQMKPILNQILDDEALARMCDLTFGAVPTKAVKKGEAWGPEVRILSMVSIGSYKTASLYTFEGLEGKLYKIKLRFSLNYTPPGANAAGNLPFKIIAEGTKLTSKDATGIILFDNEKHRLDSSTLKLELEGMLQLDIGGMTSHVELRQVQTTATKISDTNPLAVKK